jgi:iron complex transport system ATP-binding protein
MSSVLETRNLSIGYKQRTVMNALNLQLRAGEIVCLLGQNGIGKSTLMRTLAATQTPLQGEVLLQGKPIQHMKARELAKHLSIVTTERIDGHMLDGWSLVALGRHPHTDWTGQLSPEDERKVNWALEIVKAQSLAKQRVSEMSDGERQRVMIARALAQEPAVILLDEPTAFLDLTRRVEIMEVLQRLAHQTQRAVLLSTHDLELALKTADVVWLMSPNHPIEIGAPEDLILSGAFERAFTREGLHFDQHTGTFKLSRSVRGVIQLKGEMDLRYQWTQHALERIGYQVGISPQQITLAQDLWHYKGKAFASLQTLLHALD